MLGIFKRNQNKSTKVTVVVEFEVEYEGHITQDQIDYTDVFELDNINHFKKLSLKREGREE